MRGTGSVAKSKETMGAFGAAVGIKGEPTRQLFRQTMAVRTVRVIGLAFRAEHGVRYQDAILIDRHCRRLRLHAAKA